MCRWEYNIKMDLREVGWGACTRMMWLRIVRGGELLLKAVTNVRVP